MTARRIVRRGKDPDGTRYGVSEDAGLQITRGGNANLTAIPKRECALQIYCRAVRTARLLGLVTGRDGEDRLMLAMLDQAWTRGAQAVTFVPCHCTSRPDGWGGAPGHLVDHARVWAEVDRVRDIHRRGVVDVRAVEAMST